MADIRKPLLGMSLYELKEVAKAAGLPAFAGGQMAKWIYTQHVGSIDDMTNISKVGREKLKEDYVIGCMPHLERLESKDGTVKYLFPTTSGKSVETVFHTRQRQGDAMRLVTGGMQDELSFLPDRQTGI